MDVCNEKRRSRVADPMVAGSVAFLLLLHLLSTTAMVAGGGLLLHTRYILAAVWQSVGVQGHRL